MSSTFVQELRRGTFRSRVTDVHALASCLTNAWPLPANPLPVVTSTEFGARLGAFFY